VPAYNPVGADHGAHPAAHTVLLNAIHYAGYRILHHGPGSADGDAWRILAVAADQGHLLPLGHLHIDPAHRPRLLRYRRKEALGRGVLHGAGHLAGLAAQAAVQTDEYFFHLTAPAFFSGSRYDRSSAMPP